METLYIREFNKGDFQFYRECLSDINWRKSYGERQETEDMEEFIAERLINYPFVKRYIFLDTNERRVAFIVADFRDVNSTECIMGGGVAVSLISKGYGIKCSAIFCHYIFNTFPNIQKVISYYQNSASKRMLLKLGFVREPGILNHENNKLMISRPEFPGCFCSKILKKLGYVKK